MNLTFKKTFKRVQLRGGRKLHIFDFKANSRTYWDFNQLHYRAFAIAICICQSKKPPAVFEVVPKGLTKIQLFSLYEQKQINQLLILRIQNNSD